MAKREENLKKINEKLEQMSDDELDDIAGGAELPTIQPNQQGYYSQSIMPQYPPQYPSGYQPNPNPGSWNQPPQGNQPPYMPNYPQNPYGSWNQQPQGYP